MTFRNELKLLHFIWKLGSDFEPMNYYLPYNAPVYRLFGP